MNDCSREYDQESMSKLHTNLSLYDWQITQLIRQISMSSFLMGTLNSTRLKELGMEGDKIMREQNSRLPLKCILSLRSVLS